MKRIVTTAVMLCAAGLFALTLSTPSQAQQSGYEAYGYVPGGPGPAGSSCETQGDYGHPVDYSACGG